MPDPAPVDPERLLIVPRHETSEQAEPRYLLVRWPDWPHAALLSIAPPSPHDRLEDALGTLLDARLHVSLAGAPRTGESRVPVRMPMPRFGLTGTGWLRPVAVTVSGEPEADALLDGYDSLTLDEALSALPTEVERAVLREAAALF